MERRGAVRGPFAAGCETGAAARRQEDQVQRRHHTTGAPLSAISQTKRVQRRHGRYLKKVMVEYDCPECGGPPEAARRLVTIGGCNLYDVGQMHLADVLAFLKSIQPTARQRAIAETILREVTTRLELLIAIGLDYLSLNRRSATLSGGESQRIRLSSQIGWASWGCCTCWTNRASGCTPKTTSR